MEKEDKNDLGSKISVELSSRISNYGPNEMVQAIVILCTEKSKEDLTSRELPTNRNAIIESIQKSILNVLPDLDNILKENNGKRLSEGPDPIGCVSVETTVAGITALANSDIIKAILEDRPATPSARKYAAQSRKT